MSTLLLVDDNPDIVTLNKKYLASNGHHIFTADCGKSAMQALNENVFDCIVLDVLLPDVLGFDLRRKIREISNAPVIFLSCNDRSDDKITGFLSGGNDYMTKPFSMRELERRICGQILKFHL